MSEHNVYAVEHGARASLRYATCTCGWHGPPRRTQALLDGDAREHELHPVCVCCGTDHPHAGRRICAGCITADCLVSSHCSRPPGETAR
jgi:hypothetical protein